VDPAISPSRGLGRKSLRAILTSARAARASCPAYPSPKGDDPIGRTLNNEGLFPAVQPPYLLKITAKISV